MRIVDLSQLGALIEGPCRLRPGGAAYLCFAVDGEENSMACHVVRCCVSAVTIAAGLCYRAALAFERPIRLPVLWDPAGYSVPDGRPGNGVQRGSGYPTTEGE